MPLEGDAKRARIRDRYIGARFPGVLRGSADLRDVEYVIKVARHLFEEGRVGYAHELFALAIEESPRERSLRLAQLEIAFLTREPVRFTEIARELLERFPGLPEWKEVARLGHALVPGEALFGVNGGGRDQERYGPWPEMPNWIHASWDLTPDVLAGQFHHAITRANAVAPDARPSPAAGALQ